MMRMHRSLPRPDAYHLDCDYRLWLHTNLPRNRRLPLGRLFVMRMQSCRLLSPGLILLILDDFGRPQP